MFRSTLSSLSLEIPPRVFMTSAMALCRVCRVLGQPTLPVRLMMRKMQGTEVPREFRGYEPSEGDVFVTTFAKSGTNWAMQIAVQIAHRGRAEFEHIHDLVPWPESPVPVVKLADPGPRRRAPTGLRVIKTHADAPQVPYAPSARYITVIRDPKEVAVSAYYFIGGLMGMLDVMPFDEWYARIIDRGPLLEAWVRHTASFWAWRDRPNVLVLSYTEMKADLPGTVSRIAELMGVELTEQEHEQVVERAGLPYMKAHESRFAPPPMLLRRAADVPKMVRRGKAGASDEQLGPSQQADIDRWCKGQLQSVGCELPYDSMFDVAS